MENEEIENLTLHSSEWAIKEAEELIYKYKKCKTEFGKNKLRRKMEYILSRLSFEYKEIEKFM